MSIAAIVILTAVITLAAVAVGFVVYKAKSSGAISIPWDKIRPILSEVFIEVIKIREADAMGYGKLEDYAVSFVMRKIDSIDFLTKEEKGLLTADLVRAFIRPRLQELYNKKD
jgi:hypothetical protein